MRIDDDVLTATETEALLLLFRDYASRHLTWQAGDSVPHRFLPIKSSTEPHAQLPVDLAVLGRLLRLAPCGVKLQRLYVEHRPTGGYMDWHTDTVPGVKSGWTQVAYLNDNFVGGQTVVRPHGVQDEAFDTAVRARVGRVVGYDGLRCPHKVTPIALGSRFTLTAWYQPE